MYSKNYALYFFQPHCIDNALTLEALDKAVSHYKLPKGLIFHSDRGVQYTSRTSRERLDF